MIENRTILEASDLDGFDKVNDFVIDTYFLSTLKASLLPFPILFHSAFHFGSLLLVTC